MTSPDRDLTPEFWQYAIVKQKATDGLMYQMTHEVYCSHVGKKKALTPKEYAEGQAENPQFQELVPKITSASC